MPPVNLDQIAQNCTSKHEALDALLDERDKRYEAERAADRQASEHRYDRLVDLLAATDRKAENPNLAKGFLTAPVIVALLMAVAAAVGLWHAVEGRIDRMEHRIEQAEVKK